MPSLTEKHRNPQSTGSQRVEHDLSDPAGVDTRHFLACGSSAPVQFVCEGGAADWLVETLAVPSIQGHGLPLPKKLWPYQSLFPSLL